MRNVGEAGQRENHVGDKYRSGNGQKFTVSGHVSKESQWWENSSKLNGTHFEVKGSERKKEQNLEQVRGVKA